jgi:uncharacterized membrane protein SirB2
VEAWYIPVKYVHVSAVLASGSLFFVRGLALNVFGARWVMNARLRYVSYAIDTVLLSAAILLTIIIGQYPFVHAWLTVKVLLLVVYIVLGSFALKRGRSVAVRYACWLAALAVLAFIASVAVTHNPLGVISTL